MRGRIFWLSLALAVVAWTTGWCTAATGRPFWWLAIFVSVVLVAQLVFGPRGRFPRGGRE